MDSFIVFEIEERKNTIVERGNNVSGKKGNIQMYQIDAWQWFQLNWIKCIWKQIETMVFTYISCLTSTKRLLMICSLHIGVRIQSWPQESFTMLLASLAQRDRTKEDRERPRQGETKIERKRFTISLTNHFWFWLSLKFVTFKREKYFIWNFDNLFQV